jgi:hypothetical protein
MPHYAPEVRAFGRPWPGRGQPDCQGAAPMPLGHLITAI